MKIPRLLIALASLVIAASVGRAMTANVQPGDNIQISVSSDGTPPFNYQWKKNGVDIPGATTIAYNITGAKATDAGTYTVSVTNPAGSALSDQAIITVAPAGVPVTKATTTISVTKPK